MTQELDFSQVGRNDVCPCGSGQKFKKCHFRTIELQKQAQEQTIELSSFIKPKQLPFQWYKGLTLIINRRDWSLMYEAIATGSDAASNWPTVESFVDHARSSPSTIFGGGDFELRRFRILGNLAFVMGARGLEDRRSPKATFEVLALIDTEGGYRITHIERLTVEKSALPEGGDLPFEDFDCVKAAYAQSLEAPLVRPTFKRWPLPGEEPPASDAEPVEADGAGEPAEPAEPAEAAGADEVAEEVAEGDAQAEAVEQ